MAKHPHDDPSTGPRIRKILGVDPGLTATGWGIVEVAESRVLYGGSGTIKTSPREPMGARLTALYTALLDVCSTHRPEAMAIEEIFANKNGKTTLLLGQARGVLLLACVHGHVPVFEYQNRRVKKTVTGQGGASKYQVGQMVARMLGKVGKDDHATDALAIALTHLAYGKKL